MDINVTYAITVCNEIKEITTLVNFLHPRVQSSDEILIQYDSNGATKEVIDYLKIIEQLHPNVNVINFPLNKDFASFKNNLKNHANGIFIFQIDADEVPNEYLITNMHDLLEANKDIDLFFVPRVNTVKGLTDTHIQKWRWNVNEKGWVNWPDLQTRIYRRTSEIEWEGKVHERIKGYNTLTILPQEEDFSIYHPKEIERQEKQNELYDTI
jgi:glycosyltransferase involved in cell wall biosynthesis